jgi:SAM-dependent methyltransferase
MRKRGRNELANLCYNIPNASIYGEITNNGICKWAYAIENRKTKEMTGERDTFILDIGCGSGLSLSQFANCFVERQVQILGIEICHERAELARKLIPNEIQSHVTSWDVWEKDILQVQELPLITHCIAFDKTFTLDLMMHIETLQFACKTVQYVITCKKKYYERRWELESRIPCRMKGSGQVISFYLFSKKK